MASTDKISAYVTAGRRVNIEAGDRSTAEGYFTTSSGEYAHAEGYETIASGSGAHAEGSYTQASAWYSHAEGIHTITKGMSSHAEGADTSISSSGYAAHSEGSNTQAIARSCHAEGGNANTSGAELDPITILASEYIDILVTKDLVVNGPVAYGLQAHAEGTQTAALGYSSHSEGFQTITSGSASHSEGSNTEASGSYSHAEGLYTIANNYQHTGGKYNKDTTAPASESSTVGSLFIIGNGTSVSARSNAFRIATTGNVYGAGHIVLQEQIMLSILSGKMEILIKKTELDYL